MNDPQSNPQHATAGLDPALAESLALDSAFTDPNLLEDIDIRFGYVIGDVKFVLPQTLTTEFLTAPSIFPIPRSRPWLAGLINLRGNIIPVVDIAAHLGTALSTALGAKLLVIDKGKAALALAIDALPVSLNSPQAAETSPEGLGAVADYVGPGVAVEQDHWFELNVKSLVMALRDDVHGE